MGNNQKQQNQSQGQNQGQQKGQGQSTQRQQGGTTEKTQRPAASGEVDQAEGADTEA